MRAGPLSSTPIVERLNSQFVNAWVLFRDLPALEQRGSSEHVRALARTIREHAIQPVDCLVLSPAGEFVAGLWVQDLMPYGERPAFVERPAPPYRGRPNERYGEFLTDGLERSRD